jgi:hypothetical protein
VQFVLDDQCGRQETRSAIESSVYAYRIRCTVETPLIFSVDIRSYFASIGFRSRAAAKLGVTAVAKQVADEQNRRRRSREEPPNQSVSKKSEGGASNSGYSCSNGFGAFAEM